MSGNDGNGTPFPTQPDRQGADHLLRLLAFQEADGSVIIRTRASDGVRSDEIVITPFLVSLLQELAAGVSRGEGVTLITEARMLTTQQAADILNVSRPYLVMLLERGDIPHTRLNRHRRVRLADVLAYKRRRDQARIRTIDSLMAADADLL